MGTDSVFPRQWVDKRNVLLLCYMVKESAMGNGTGRIR